jgi:translocation and assembly module TamB
VRYPKLFVAGLVLVLLVAGLGWLAGSNAGLRFLVDRVLIRLPGTVEIATLDGRLVGPISATGIEVELPDGHGSIARLDLDWRPWALLRGTLHVQYLHIASPQLELHPPGAETRAPPPESPDAAGVFRLPFAITLEDFTLGDGMLKIAGEPLIEALELVLAGRATGQQLDVSHLAMRSAQGQADGHARLSLAPDDPWDVQLSWQLEWPEVPPLAGRTRLTGSLAALAIEQALTAPVAAQLTGTLHGLPAVPGWELAVRVEALPPRGGPWPELLDGMDAELRSSGRREAAVLEGELGIPNLAPGRIRVDAAASWSEAILALHELRIEFGRVGQVSGHARLATAGPIVGDFQLTGVELGWPLGVAEPDIALPRMSVRGRGDAQGWRLNLDGRVVYENLPELDLAADLDWTGTVLMVERLALRSPDDSVQATAQGRLDMADERFEYHLTAEARLALPDLPLLDAQLKVAGDAEGLRVESLAAHLLEGRIEGEGRIAWAGADVADFQLQFYELDPAGLAPDWPGRLSGALRLKGLPELPGGLDFELDDLRGELRGLAAGGEIRANLAPPVLLLRPSRLQLGETRLVASGRLDDDTVTFEARLDASELQALHPAAQGRITASGRLDGERTLPRMRLQVSGDDLRWQQARAGRLRIEADLDPGGARPSQLAIEADELAAAPGPGARLRLGGAGTPDEHALQLSLQRSNPVQGLRLAVEGGLAEERWTGHIRMLELEAEEQQIWGLQRPAPLHVDTAGAVLDDACMDGVLGLLCIAAAWRREGPWRGSASLEELELGPLSEWLRTGLLAQGIMSGEVLVEADDDGFRALAGQLLLTAGDIRLEAEDSPALISWEAASLQLAGDEREARMELAVALGGADRVEGHLAVGWNDPDPRLDGRVEAELAQLELITEFFPELANLEGRAEFMATLSGTLGTPHFTGRFEWLDGTAQIPTLGLRPRALNVSAQLEDGVLDFVAAGRSGEGSFEADGRFELDGATLTGRATLRGDDLLLADLPEARIAASPELRFDYSERGLVIAGDVRIPFARISGVGGPTAISTSPDEVLVGPRAPADEEDELVVRSRVRVTVGPDVQVQAAGLRGRIEGQVLTVTEPRALPWARGELRVVEGTFGAFGQRLEIETGRLIYTGGPLENPGLDIRAVRRVDQVTAGALVRGTLQQPEISVYSDPPLPSAEALSYLTLGKGLDQLQAGEQSAVNQAAGSLALSGGGLIAQDLGRRIGFDDVAVTAADDQTALVVSKYLGAGLYVSYGLGLFDTVNTVRLRYQINQRLSLEATSGEESAADLFYTFERD